LLSGLTIGGYFASESKTLLMILQLEGSFFMVLKNQNRRLFLKVIGAVLLASFTFGSTVLAAEVRELVSDARFLRGFTVLAPRHGEPTLGQIAGSESGEPVWRIAQWGSKFPTLASPPESLPSGQLRYANRAKAVTVRGSDSEGADLTLMVDSRDEYGKRCRVPVGDWPHLLVEQPIVGLGTVDKIGSLRLHLDARLVYDTVFKREKFDPQSHTAQVNFVLIVQNRNRESDRFGDFFWFVVPIYDTRYGNGLPRYVAEDTADPSTKLIYNPGSEAIGGYNLHDKKWHTIDVDLNPPLKLAFEAARQRGYLQKSENWGDFRITSLNFGWEVTGINHAAIELKNLSLSISAE
jgi:hypothetical protein